MQTHVSVKAPVFWLVCHIVVILRRRCFSCGCEPTGCSAESLSRLVYQTEDSLGSPLAISLNFFLKDIFHSVHDRVTCLNGRTTLSVITEHLHKNKPQRLVSVIHSSLLRSGTLSTRRHVPTSCAKLKDITV